MDAPSPPATRMMKMAAMRSAVVGESSCSKPKSPGGGGPSAPPADTKEDPERMVRGLPAAVKRSRLILSSLSNLAYVAPTKTKRRAGSRGHSLSLAALRWGRRSGAAPPRPRTPMGPRLGRSSLGEQSRPSSGGELNKIGISMHGYALHRHGVICRPGGYVCTLDSESSPGAGRLTSSLNVGVCGTITPLRRSPRAATISSASSLINS